MKAPEIIIMLGWFISIGINLAKHGEQKKGKHNVFIEIISTLISYFFLRWAGLFQ